MTDFTGSEFHLIYSADILGSEGEINFMGPFRKSGPLPGQWVETEGDEQYEFSYLAEDDPKQTYYLAVDDTSVPYVEDVDISDEGWEFLFSIKEVDYYHRLVPQPDVESESLARILGTGEYCKVVVADVDGYKDGFELEVIDKEDLPQAPAGRHRKWCGVLTYKEWVGFCDELCIDLTDEGLPENYNETMGALTHMGLLPAIAVDNSEAWSPTDVIMSDIYISILMPEIMSNIVLGYN